MATTFSKSEIHRLLPYLYRGIYLVAVAFFILKFIGYRHEDFGYTALAHFGAEFSADVTEELRQTRHFVQNRGEGYDGQFYAQLALHPDLSDPGLPGAIDNFAYRARRILFSWTAYALGLGKPEWVLQAYSIQNAIAWLLLAGLLLRWFPPDHWQNAVRYLSVLFSAGMIGSLNFALLDGPSLLLIALAAALAERGRSWLAALALGVAGLAKETNLLAGGALLRGDRPIGSRVLLLLLAILPFVAWYGYLNYAFIDPSNADLGLGNFTFPLVGLLGAVLSALKDGGELGFPSWIFAKFFLLAGLSIQAGYLFFKRRPDLVWWRIGIAFATLMLVLGHSVWEGRQPAALRVLLPLTLSFNVLFTRRGRFAVILILANIGAIVGVSSLERPNHDRDLRIAGDSKLIYDAESDAYLSLAFRENWHVLEEGGDHYWRWCSQPGTIDFQNPNSEALYADFEFTLRVLEDRAVTLSLNGKQIYRQQLATGYDERRSFFLTLEPGENTFVFETNGDPVFVSNDPRPLAFGLYDFQLTVKGLAPSAVKIPKPSGG